MPRRAAIELAPSATTEIYVRLGFGDAKRLVRRESPASTCSPLH